MERILHKFSLLTFFLFVLCIFTSGQDITGIWRGYFITDGGEQYKLEFQIKQNNSSSIKGVSYSYLDVRFYGKATMTGILKKSEQKFQIQELRTVEVKNPGGGGTCLMNYSFNFARSGKEEFLEGTFLGRSEDRNNPKNNGEWGDCGGGTVYLRRVQTSEFYVEPFLRDKPRSEVSTEKPRINPPIAKKNPPKTNSQAVKKNPVAKTTLPTTRNRQTIGINTGEGDSTGKIVIPPQVKNPEVKRIAITPNILKTRENALARTITVNTEEVTIKLYDNGEIDDDSISVFVDNQLMLSHKRLSAEPITLKLRFDVNEEEHEVVMVAENLGRIPPNTSLMVINAGDKRYQVQITSTEQKNALVRFRFEKPS